MLTNVIPLGGAERNRITTMGKKKKKQTEAQAAEEKEQKEEADFNEMLAEFKQDDAREGRQAREPPPEPVST